MNFGEKVVIKIFTTSVNLMLWWVLWLKIFFGGQNLILVSWWYIEQKYIEQKYIGQKYIGQKYI
jgi:hypothetical protein